MLLEKLAGYQVPYRRRDVATRQEFDYLLDRYLDSGYDDYPILYLSFHGYGPGEDYAAGLTLGDGTSYSLDDLEALINGRCNGRVIHFGACSVMSAPGERLQSFLASSGAVAMCGYTEDVDWLESAAFDLLLLGTLQWAAFNTTSVKKITGDLGDRAPVLCTKLGFEIRFDDGATK